MKLLKITMPILAIVFIQGCSVANIKPFADEAVKVNALVAEEVKEINIELEKAEQIGDESRKRFTEQNCTQNSDEESCKELKRIVDKQGNKNSYLCQMYNKDTKKVDESNQAFQSKVKGLDEDVKTAFKKGITVFAPRLCMKGSGKRATYNSKQIVSKRALIMASNNALSSSFGELSQYAHQLTVLAAKGDGSDEAIDSLQANINSALSLLGFATVTIATEAVKKGAKLLQHKDVNDGLREAVTAADDAIKNYATLIKEVAAYQQIQIASIARVKHNNSTNLIPMQYIRAEKKAYGIENAAVASILINSKLCGGKNASNCFSSSDLSNFKAMVNFYDQYVRPKANAIREERKKVAQWKAEKIASWQKISQLTAVLAKEHGRLQTTLDTCKMGSLKKCVQFKPSEIFSLIK